MPSSFLLFFLLPSSDGVRSIVSAPSTEVEWIAEGVVGENWVVAARGVGVRRAVGARGAVGMEGVVGIFTSDGSLERKRF